jgi:hypothetical protein
MSNTRLILFLLLINSILAKKKVWAVQLKQPYRWYRDGWLKRNPLPITSEQLADNIADRIVMRYLEPLNIGQIEGIHLFEQTDEDDDSDSSTFSLEHVEEVVWAEVQVPRKRVKRDLPLYNDPMLAQQWFLVRFLNEIL